MKNSIDYVVEQYSDMIFRTSFAYLNNYSEAEDIVSDVFMKYFSNLKNRDFNDDEHLKAWLIRVTINQCKDILKSARFKKNQKLDNNHIKNFDWSEAEIDVKNALDKLDQKYRIVLFLHYYQDYKIKEIAKILNISKGTVLSRLSRARNTFQITVRRCVYE